MKFTVQKKELYSKLQNAGRVISNRNTLPILDCFLLGLSGTELKIAGSDTEIRISTKVDVSSSEGDGMICVDAKTMLDALRELPDQPLNISVNPDNFEVIIEYHNGKYTFIGQEAKDYPQPNKLTEKERNEINIPSETLLSALNETAFAVSNDELRPVMTGLYFDISTDKTTFVASDGNKLVKLTNYTIRCSDNCSFILPTKAINLLKTLLPKQDQTVKVRFDLNRAIIDLPDYSIIARFIEGRYPNYNSVIPANNPNRFEVSRDVILAAVKRVGTLSNKQTNLICFDLKQDSLTVSSQDIDFSTSAEESLDVEYNGVPMQIGFKSTFLTEILSSVQDESVIFELSDSTRAGLIKPSKDREGWESIGLLMPMLLND